jgi:hypothetical protein
LIGHEYISSAKGEEYGMFSKSTIAKIPNLNQRIKEFAKIGKQTI